jgi:predicted nucleic acid-binding protein
VSFVLDSSVALSWCFSDEKTPETLEVLKSAQTQPILVPSLWHIEMCNVLGLAFRRQRLTALDLDVVLKMFSALEVHTDTTFSPVSASVLLPLMQKWSLTAYDAVYLELAQRLNLPLATLDKELARAAGQAGVTLLCHPQ